MGNKTILVAEDEEVNFLFILEVLKKLDVKVEKVINGVDAVEFCKNNDVDLVLMDIKMPRLNGYEATRQIREFKPDLPIIAQTAYALLGDRDKALEAGCNDYISKPIKKEVLKQKVLHFLGEE